MLSKANKKYTRKTTACVAVEQYKLFYNDETYFKITDQDKQSGEQTHCFMNMSQMIKFKRWDVMQLAFDCLQIPKEQLSFRERLALYQLLELSAHDA